MELPNHQPHLLPRERNDHLAGQGADICPPEQGIELHTNIHLPEHILSKANLYHATQSQTLTLKETPHVHIPVLAAYWHQHLPHRADLARYLARLNSEPAATSCTIHYWRTSNDGKGRLYAQGPAAQRLPKHLRILLYGRAHAEIDVIGAFYEIIRRKASALSPTQQQPIPPVMQARATLQHEILKQQPLCAAAPIAKRLLHIAINAPPSAVTRHLAEQGIQPTPVIVITALTQSLLQYGPRNKNFFHLEGVEADQRGQTAT